MAVNKENTAEFFVPQLVTHPTQELGFMRANFLQLFYGSSRLFVVDKAH